MVLDMTVSNTVLRLRLPFRRPPGLPDWPDLNWVCRGGLPRPISKGSGACSARGDVFFDFLRAVVLTNLHDHDGRGRAIWAVSLTGAAALRPVGRDLVRTES